MSSVREIAEQAGVSITTVSRALNNDPAVHTKTRERVLDIANRAGYVATMGKRITTNVGFVYTGEQTLAHPYDAAVLDGVANGLNECRFNLMIVNLQRDKERYETYTQFFMRKGLRGVLLRTMADSRATCQAIADERFPHVVLSERFESENVNYIDGDLRHEAHRAVEYLISLGHRQIGFAMHNVPDRDHNDRLEGFRSAMTEAGLEVREDLVFRQQYTLSGGATVVKMAMSKRERPTAVFFADPMMAVGAVKTAHELGINIPAELSIVGFDDTDVRLGTYPTFTAVCQNAAQLGFEAALWLTRYLTGTAKTHLRKSIPCFLEVNGSTARRRILVNEGLRIVIGWSTRNSELGW